MRRKKDGLLTQTRERVGTGTPKRRKKEGVFDRINEKRLPIPSKKTSWEMSFFLLQMPAAAATPPAKKTLVSLHTTTSSPSSSHLLSPSSSITPTQCSRFPHHTRAHNSSSPLIDTSFVMSIMTAISVWERKKEKKKGVEAYDGYWGMMDITVIKGIQQEVSLMLH